MPSPEVLDFDTLLTAIPGDNPAGEDLRGGPSSSLYYAVKDARSAARSAERQMVVEGEESATPPDWRPVLRHGLTALSEKTKDLEVTAYLIEALVRLHGFAGLRDGFRLARELVERFWDGLYPLPDEDGLETRVAPLMGLNGGDSEGTLITPIARVPLTEGVTVGPFAQFHYQQAQALGKVQDEEARQARLAQGAIPLESFAQAVAETPAAFLTNVVEDINQCRSEFTNLCQLLEEKCGPAAPPYSNIRAVLDACLDTITTMARDKLAAAMPAPEEPTEAQGEDGKAAASAAGQQAAVPGVIRDREDAFETLLKVAEFFRRTEPHTPVSFALEQAVRWGRMSLPELMMELIPDEPARLQFFKQVGIQRAAPAQ